MSDAESPWSLDAITPPWYDRPSIYSHVFRQRCCHPRQEPFPDDLPDEPPREEPTAPGVHRPRLAPGMADGFARFHVAGRDDETAARVLDALYALTDRADGETADALYSLLLGKSAVRYFEPMASGPPDLRAAVPESTGALRAGLSGPVRRAATR